MTENRAFSKLLPRLFKRAFGVSFDSVSEGKGENGKITFQITDRASIYKIIDSFGYERDGLLAHHINYGIIEEECCRQSFVRGAFLAGGA